MGSEGRPIDGMTVTGRRPLRRTLLFGALICFALPFLTVTCYGESTTVSGIQAATSIDLDPNGTYGEAELARDESANVFALLALVATAAATVFAFRMRDPRGVVVAAAVGVIALEALHLYALHRATGEAVPRIGFVGALFLLVGAAWTTVERVPRWIPVAIGALAIPMLPGAIVAPGDVGESPVLFLPVVFGGLFAVAIVVGALHGRAERGTTVVASSAARVTVAGVAALAIVAIGIIGGFFLASAVSSNGASDLGEDSYLFALVTVAVTVAASSFAWAAGRAIARRRKRPPEAVVAVP